MLARQVPTCAGAEIRTVRRPPLLTDAVARRRGRSAVRRAQRRRRRRLCSLGTHATSSPSTSPATSTARSVRAAAARLQQWIAEGTLVRDAVADVHALPHAVHRRGRYDTRDRWRARRARGGRRGGRRRAAARAHHAEGEERSARPDPSHRTPTSRPCGGCRSPQGSPTCCASRPSRWARVTTSTACVHTVERVTDPARVAAISAAVGANPVLIADGHHRYAISRTFRDERRSRGRRWSATAPPNSRSPTSPNSSRIS